MRKNYFQEFLILMETQKYFTEKRNSNDYIKTQNQK